MLHPGQSSAGETSPPAMVLTGTSEWSRGAEVCTPHCIGMWGAEDGVPQLSRHPRRAGIFWQAVLQLPAQHFSKAQHHQVRRPGQAVNPNLRPRRFPRTQELWEWFGQDLTPRFFVGQAHDAVLRCLAAFPKHGFGYWAPLAAYPCMSPASRGHSEPGWLGEHRRNIHSKISQRHMGG